MLSPLYYRGWTVGDFIVDMGLGFFTGNAIKYLCRWREKNGLEDLRKMQVYLNRIMEMYEDGTLMFREIDISSVMPLDEAARIERTVAISGLAHLFDLGETETQIIEGICEYARVQNLQSLKLAINLGQKLLDQYQR